ncbi:DUF808 domain-containing protein [Testudinibacter sp. TR-2022]|uniref:DUF808 domain-containing protein n=1 Tax=Testudinibacter sp. TR-2022 TaxID=2585029 RepID=UPI001118119D|nr:DUF808 domain-containing protein [Testudinibacter sp. TR-2022]TNH04582.1 DUF808 domain-containing protein [Pasteurellaceae bacterium Phil31]TNH09404.1 DUF808 domain-containing protein [Testudinibacter sp. TR-2022]TNH09809.1 DUF808 domain-containing protein [Testudinibacter sp. TR-2022]TNH13854.1 DUF808 domain-containing protein [Testudinibacter sp. TR-2022]TNH20677.1 DUF808 domain-containing protein [Testudinibacter sp. TR-2022]
MAFASLFTLLDDITAVLDDVALMTKVAAKKTAGVVGDDLALNANQVAGVRAERELPVVWAVAKGSFWNKVILVPLALLISSFFPVAIPYLLMIGGAYLCFEGVEKIFHKLLHKPDNAAESAVTAELSPQEEQAKIKGAIRTDFILSAEIVTIALGMVSDYNLLTQTLVLSAIALGMTVLVYGLVGGIVKLDDLGFWLMRKQSAVSQALGRGIIFVMPHFMRLLSVVGTLAMFLVGGGIIAHNLGILHYWLEQMNWLEGWAFNLASLIIGVVCGAVVLLVVASVSSVFKRKATH